MSEQEKQPDNQTMRPIKKTYRKILCVGSAVIFVPVLGLVTALSFDSAVTKPKTGTKMTALPTHKILR